MTGERVRAIRGATSVGHDAPEQIVDATIELVQELLDRNGLSSDDLISMVFTLTTDLQSEFPAVAARQLGLSAVPLLCAQEIPVPGSLEKCIRVLVHCYAPAARVIRHVYLHEARRLRLDLIEEPADDSA
ncbi:MAG TPA: chorismate mutase [Miltoncostaeales bacterium]|jgi:chorismate mutase|nr:chorismate mutase [Miltoncostaeales bacterium]